MRALILAYSESETASDAMRVGPGAMAPVAGKPLVQHMVEHLVGLGVEEVDFLTEGLHEGLVDLFGDGTRWGIRVAVHDVEEQHFAPQVRALSGERPEQPVLLGRADVLPRLSGAFEVDSEVPVYLRLAGNQRGTRISRRWTGWAFLPAGTLETHGEDYLPESVLDLLMAGDFLVGRWKPASVTLDARDPEGLLEANSLALDGSFPELMLPAQEVAPGIWFGPRVDVAEDVEMEAPVFLGEEVVVGPGCRLGPGCSIGDRAIVDEGVEVTHSVVVRGTYIGRGLRLRQAVAGGDWLTNVRLRTTVEIHDEALLADLDIPVVTRILHCMGRNLARARSLLACLRI